jgi:hypothetical protein
MRTAFRLAVLAFLFTFASLANSALSWHLPLPDLIPKTEPAPQCVLPGTVPKTTPPGAATVTAYGDPAATGQPAGFGAVIPDLPSAMGKVQGQLLHKLNGPPPSQAQLQGVARAVGSGAARWYTSFRAAANGKDDPAQVTAYQERQRAAFLAQNATSCNPCQPGADGTPDPYNQAKLGLRGEDLARRAATAAGFTGQHLEEAVAIANAESGFNPTAANPTSNARGMWQIMLTAHQDDPEIDQWRDPYANARMAYRISSRGTNWAPWSTWPAVRGKVGKVQPVAGGMQCASFPTTGYKTGAGKPWGPPGGPLYRNGRIPASALAHPVTAPRHLLRPDAAAAFDRLSTAYRARFGHPLGVTDSYRDIAGQVSVYARKPGLAAKPGTSNHGWALALDVVVGGYGSTDYLWLRTNAPQFGWDNPGWARPGGSKHEPWHWEYQPTGART